MSYKSIYSGDEIDSAVEYFKKNFKNLNIVTVSNMYKTIEEIPLFDSSGGEANEKFITTNNAYYGLLQITIGEDSPNDPLSEGLERRTVLMLQSLNFNGGTVYATNEYKVQQILFGYKSSVYIRNITESFTESWKEADVFQLKNDLNNMQSKVAQHSEDIDNSIFPDLGALKESLASHTGDTSAHVTGDDKTRWDDKYTKIAADNKFALIENGVIEVKEAVVGNFSDILVYDKNGNATTDIEDIHTGTFRLFVKYEVENEDENPDVIFIIPDDEYLLMEQRIVTFDGMGVNKIVQTILMNNQLYTRVTGDLNFLVGEFGEFVAIDLTPVDTLESDDANAPLSANMGRELNEKKEDISNKSTTIDDAADDTTYPTTSAVKTHVNDSIEELRSDIHAEILTDGNDQVLYIMNNRFKLFD